MPATVTLPSTNFLKFAEVGDRMITVESTSGLTPGVRLYCEGELMTVVSLGVGSGEVNVRRGVDGTSARYHEPSAPIWIGRADQFYSQDPSGSPDEIILVSPYINVQNGSVWFAQGDAGIEGPYRWWQKQAMTADIGPLGVRTFTYAPTSST